VNVFVRAAVALTTAMRQRGADISYASYFSVSVASDKSGGRSGRSMLDSGWLGRLGFLVIGR